MPRASRPCLLLVLTLPILAAWGPPPEPSVAQAPAAEIRFDELFKPIGPGGLEYSARLRSMEGRRVRFRGYMAAREAAPPGTFLLTPFPVQLHETEYGLADDLPPATVFVEVPAWRGRTVPYRPGPVTVTGILQLGNREEPDGRVSSVRLVLDGPDHNEKKGE